MHSKKYNKERRRGFLKVSYETSQLGRVFTTKIQLTGWFTTPYQGIVKTEMMRHGLTNFRKATHNSNNTYVRSLSFDACCKSYILIKQSKVILCSIWKDTKDLRQKQRYEH